MLYRFIVDATWEDLKIKKGSSIEIDLSHITCEYISIKTNPLRSCSPGESHCYGIVTDDVEPDFLGFFNAL